MPQTFQPLTPEQYQKARSAGFSPDQIIENEKTRKSQSTSTPSQPVQRDPFNPLAPTGSQEGIKKAVDFAAPLVGDIKNVVGGTNTKTPLQILGDTALTAAWAIPGLGAAGTAAKGLVPRILAGSAIKGATIGYGSGIASDLSQGKTLPQAIAPDTGKIVGALAGGATGGLLGRLGGGAEALKKSATTNVTKVLNPTTKINKQITQKIAPELAQRSPLALTREGLLTKYEANMGDAAIKLEDAYKDLPQEAKFEVTNLFDTLQKKIEGLSVNGTVPSSVTGRVTALQDMMKDLANIGVSQSEDGSKVFADVANVRKLRQLLDTGKRKFSFTDLDAARQGAQKQLSNAIRSEFGKQFPIIAKFNKEFSFWSKASQVLSDTIERKTGQSGIVRKIGEGAIGAMLGAPTSHPIIGTAVFTALAELMQSPAWRLMGALAKSKLASMLEKGDASGASTLIQKSLQLAPLGASRGAQGVVNSIVQ